MSKSLGDSKSLTAAGSTTILASDNYWNAEKKTSPIKWESFADKSMSHSVEGSQDWGNPLAFVAALVKVEAWIFSRIVESVWWQIMLKEFVAVWKLNQTSHSEECRVLFNSGGTCRWNFGKWLSRMLMKRYVRFKLEDMTVAAYRCCREW